MVVIQGTDVSVVQNVVPYDLLRQQGHVFSWIRCKVGNNAGKDIRFEANYKAATDAGIYASPYQFPFPLPHLDPIAQVQLFVEASTVGGHLVGSTQGELQPAFDLEWPPPEEWLKWKCTAQQIVDWSLKALESMRRHWGRKPKVYSYPYFLQALSKADGFNELVKYGLWIAGGNQYLNGDGHVPDLTKEAPPNVAGWGHKWEFWQHDGNGGKHLPNGADADFSVFRGTMDEFKALCGQMDDDLPDTEPAPMQPDFPIVTNFNEMIEAQIHDMRQSRAYDIVNFETV